MRDCGFQEMKSKLVLSLIIIAGALGFTSLSNDSDCINLYVDYGILDQDKKVISCIPSDKAYAIDVLREGGIAVEGTDRYGLDVVCRVEGLPGPDIEQCKNMPPENAYWAIIVKDKFSLINLFPKWGWAQLGVADLELNQGDSLGLVFVKDGDLKWPD
jgi:hypothetical protein